MRGAPFAQQGENPMSSLGPAVLCCVMCCLCIFLTLIIACKSFPNLHMSHALYPYHPFKTCLCE